MREMTSSNSVDNMTWDTVCANKFCASVTDGTHDSPKPQKFGKKLITSKHLMGDYIDFDSANWISENDYKKIISRSIVEQWDVLFSMIGTIGNIYIEKNPVVKYACKNMGIFKFAGNKENAYWMYYYLQSPQAKEYFQSHLRGSTQSYVPLCSLREMPVPIPDKKTRNGIVSLLRSLDVKIAISRKINDNLADLLQTIYQERFVNDILAVNQGVLSDICSYSRDKVAVSELNVRTYFSTENMLSGKAGSTEATSLPTTSQTTACHKGDTLISNIRPYFKKIVYCEDKCGCSTDVLCFTPSQPRYSAYLFSTLYADKFFAFMVAGSKGTKMPRGDKQQIMTYPVVLPSEEELAGFNTIASPLLEQIYSNRAENKRLSILRDTLLPKLMSGEIDVSAVQL